MRSCKALSQFVTMHPTSYRGLLLCGFIGILTFYIPFFVVVLPQWKVRFTTVPIESTVTFANSEGYSKVVPCTSPFLVQERNIWLTESSLRTILPPVITVAGQVWTVPTTEDIIDRCSTEFSYSKKYDTVVVETGGGASNPFLHDVDITMSSILTFILGGFSGFLILAPPVAFCVILINLWRLVWKGSKSVVPPVVTLDTLLPHPTSSIPLTQTDKQSSAGVQTFPKDDLAPPPGYSV